MNKKNISTLMLVVIFLLSISVVSLILNITLFNKKEINNKKASIEINKKIIKTENFENIIKIKNNFILLNKNLKNDILVFSKNDINLPEKSKIINIKNGETTEKEYTLKWLGTSLKDINNYKKGEYQVYVKLSDDLKINDENYGKIIITVKVKVE